MNKTNFAFSAVVASMMTSVDYCCTYCDDGLKRDRADQALWSVALALI